MSEEKENTSIEELNNTITEDVSKLDHQLKQLEENSEAKKDQNLPKAQQEWTNVVDSTKNMFGKWQKDWKTTHEANMTKIKEKQVESKNRQETRRKRRLEKQKKINEKVDHFFKSQQALFEDKIRQMENQFKEDQAKMKQKALDRQQKLQDQKQNRIDQREKKKEENQQARILRKELHEQNIQQKQDNRLDKKRQKLEYQIQSREMRQESWDKFSKRQQKRTRRFLKFQNRLWWKGYFTFMAWILMILIVIVGIGFILNYIGFNVTDLLNSGT